MRKRGITTGLLAAALTLGAVVPAAAADRTVPVQVDGAVLDTVNYLDSGVTYVPLRALLDAFGGWEVHWDSETKAAVAVAGTTRLSADPTADTITVNGHTYNGNVSVRSGRTYVPLRLAATVCGAGVVWDRVLGGAAVTSPDAAYDAEDLYWLSRIISAESQGEPLEGQIAVGNVVLNRVDSAEFPNSIREVVFDAKDGVQFEPVSNGTVYNDPTDSAVKAAKMVLDGAETVGSCLYFYAPALSKGLWVNANRNYFTTIGCHRFYL